MSNSIQLHKVSFNFLKATPILRDITLTINSGDFVGIVGANGSGKTTLARLLNANLQPTSGIVLVDGLLSSDTRRQLAIRERVALVAADPENQFITSTVFDEITFALRATGLEAGEIIQRSEEALNRFNLGAYRDAHPFYLSVGEQFRVLLATALVRQPRYLVLDEINSMMDSFVRHNILQIVRNLQTEEGLGIILLTHRLEDLFYTDQIIVIQEGQIKTNGTPASILAQTLTKQEWKIEAPLLYQLARLLPSAFRSQFPEPFSSISAALFPDRAT